MNRQVHPDDNYEIGPEYDFSHGVRGKHFEAYRAGTNVVFLEPDVAKAFRDSASVNQVLRLLLQLARTNIPSAPPAVRQKSLDELAAEPGKAGEQARFMLQFKTVLDQLGDPDLDVVLTLAKKLAAR